MTITYRLTKGSALTHAELDGNFSHFADLLKVVSGKLGLGTSSPSYLLTVQGDQIAHLNTAGDTRAGIGAGLVTSGEVALDAYKSTGAAMVVRTANDSGTLTERMRVDSSGNVGIGHAPGSTGAATGRLEIGTASGTPTRLLMSQESVANYSWVIPASTAALTLVYGSATERMRIDASGYMMVGTTTPKGRLTIAGAGPSQSVSYSYLNSSGTVGSNSSSVVYGLWTDARVAAVEFNAISDARLKQSVQPLPARYGYDLVKRLQAVQFQLNGDAVPTVGFIAQELVKAGGGVVVKSVEDDDPQLVEHTDQDGFVSPAGSKFTVNYDGVAAILADALKAAIVKIESLEARVAALESAC